VQIVQIDDQTEHEHRAQDGPDHRRPEGRGPSRSEYDEHDPDQTQKPQTQGEPHRQVGQSDQQPAQSDEPAGVQRAENEDDAGQREQRKTGHAQPRGQEMMQRETDQGQRQRAQKGPVLELKRQQNQKHQPELRGDDRDTTHLGPQSGGPLHLGVRQERSSTRYGFRPSCRYRRRKCRCRRLPLDVLASVRGRTSNTSLTVSPSRRNAAF